MTRDGSTRIIAYQPAFDERNLPSRSVPDYLGVRAVRMLGIDPDEVPTYWTGLDGQLGWPVEELLSYLGLAEGEA
jgi:hypothetical protein